MKSLSQKDIENWLIEWTAKQLKLEADTIDIKQSFLNYTTDSLMAMMIVGDLEDWLGCRLSPTLMWDYSTMESLAEYLFTQAGGDVAPDSAPAKNEKQADDTDETDKLLENLDNLSEDEMDNLLGQLLVSEQSK